MKRILTALLLLTLLAAAGLAEGGRTLHDPVSGGKFYVEEEYDRAVVIRGEYGGCILDSDGEEWAYQFQKDGQTAELFVDHLSVCAGPLDAVTHYSPLIFSALPESIDDVTRINRAMTLLPDSMYFSVTLNNAGEETVPVYAAPEDNAYRAATGKVSVSLRGEVVVLDWRDGFMMVFYASNDGSAHVGWVKENEPLIRAMADKGHEPDTFLNSIHRWGRMPAYAARQTALTDAPDLCGDALVTLEVGEEFICLGRWGSLLAVAETTHKGKTVRGFVPLKDVDIPEPPVDAQAMTRLSGTSWVFYAGGSMFADFQHFRSDGVIIGGYTWDGGWIPEGQGWDLEPDMITEWKTRAYTVSRYDPAWGLYWADVPYMMTFVGKDGHMNRYGLDFDDDSFNLFTSEGSGGSIPYTGSLDAVPRELLEPKQAPFTSIAQLDAAVTAGYEVLSSDVHDHEIALLLRAEDGAEVLRFVWRQSDGTVTFVTTEPLPRGGSLDTVHAREGVFLFDFTSNRGVVTTISFRRNAWGVWYPSQVMGEAIYGLSAHALIDVKKLSPGRNDGYHYGFHPWNDWTCDLMTMPATLDEALLQLDCIGYAVVNNPNPADRLHLRVKPDRSSTSLGKFYNRTPVIVDRVQGDWVQVIVGSNMKGWMMKKYLAFGEEMDAVACAFPQLMPAESSAEDGVPVYETPDASQEVFFYAGGGDFIAGVHTDRMGNEWYLVLSADGLHCGYARKQDYEAGNG